MIGLTRRQERAKRALDLAISIVVLVTVCWWLIPVLTIVARLSTGASGIYRQTRIGRHGEPFELLKIRTMRLEREVTTTITRRGDPRITKVGAALRRHKLDELPQFWNVLRGDMSLVGPRPDVSGYYDRLEEPYSALLSLRPGMTGPASLTFKNEEEILASCPDPVAYNDHVLFPEKLRLNFEYLQSWSVSVDLKILARTLT